LLDGYGLPALKKLKAVRDNEVPQLQAELSQILGKECTIRFDWDTFLDYNDYSVQNTILQNLTNQHCEVVRHAVIKALEKLCKDEIGAKVIKEKITGLAVVNIPGNNKSDKRVYVNDSGEVVMETIFEDRSCGISWAEVKKYLESFFEIDVMKLEHKVYQEIVPSFATQLVELLGKTVAVEIAIGLDQLTPLFELKNIKTLEDKKSLRKALLNTIATSKGELFTPAILGALRDLKRVDPNNAELSKLSAIVINHSPKPTYHGNYVCLNNSVLTLSLLIAEEHWRAVFANRQPIIEAIQNPGKTFYKENEDPTPVVKPSSSPSTNAQYGMGNSFNVVTHNLGHGHSVSYIRNANRWGYSTATIRSLQCGHITRHTITYRR